MKKLFTLLVFICIAQMLAAQCEGISGSISPNSGNICQGEVLTLTATGGTSYEWSLDGNIIAGETGATLNATQAGTYSVIIIDGDCRVPADNTAEVTVTPIPTGAISPSTASICPGNAVTLTATGGDSYTWFRNGTEINGENNATINVNQEGSYTVSIHVGDCTGQASNASTITTASAPTGSISPASASICAGGSTTLTATGGTTYTWFRDGTEINGETGATLNVTQAGTYTATIHQGDCSGPASNSVTVTTATTPTGTISPASATICSGNSTTLTATGGTSYTWFRNNKEIDGQTDATLTVTQPGTYSAIIHQGDCSGEASNTASVTGAAAPTGTITPANASICAGGSTTLTATGGDSYTWFRNGTQINGQTGETITVTQAGTYTVTIHQGDCSGPASNSAVITVASSPSGTISPALASICPGGSQVLTATGGTTYTWFLNGTEIEGETGSTITVAQAGVYSATIHQGNCSGAASNTTLITVTPTPVGTISPATGSICEGGSITLTATGGTSYTWFLNGDEIEGETGATLNASAPGTYFAIIRQGTCSGPAVNTSVITQTTAPSGTIAPATGTICAGGSIVLTATGGTSYSWFRNGTLINGQTAATLNVTQAGTYTATIKQGTCSGNAANSSVITVSNAPTGNISPAEASICAGGTVPLTATGGTSYVWFLNGTEIAGQTGATLNATQTGTYTVTIKQGDCSGPGSNSSTVTVGEAPTGNISPANAALCGGSSAVLTATGGTTYTWKRDGEVIQGQTAAALTVTEAGTYSVTIKNGTCEGEAANTSVVTIENSEGQTYPDINARPGVPVQLEARDIGATYEWMPATDLNDPTSRTPTATVSADRQYSVKITTASGCVITDQVSLKVKSVIFVPTGFTPNKNGVNDLLRPKGELKSLESFKVFNRWGQMMFQTKEMGAGWDGKYKGTDQPSDTYTWILTGVGNDGQPIKITGKTFLIR
jgi:gliding motility-associated-like protein